ncbi:antibiotic biosynthesis monooxygenase [Helcobacillus sp. ACRRO]|uniref:antibiotic biosynthesis monooxygenase family protein n=1 Tax=Helcobacillus TaxID=1161125 RepID=UPI001EF65D93|nr:MULTISPECIES: antibiotic biosynthesis monooxygenase [Helcobacillus]MCG7426211.1 antibiotic biosynthesis monooxygenase [Helcobacillus sp. ACRRO]MDK7742576.1 antibiotic biosynthesis monooxygenase [Helcobacillus massiliensis]WOO92262.1 antibiotic biosynthesis monooxygenase [Helcobacillus massiliensis]
MTVVKINQLSVPVDRGADLEAKFAARRKSVDSEPGFEGFELLRPAEEGQPYFVVTRWADDASFDAWAAKRQPRAEGTTVSKAEGLLSFEVVDLDG